jgi:uncharacterized protein (UPF0332 family)
MNPRDIQNVARDLLSHKTAAHNRSAISRAYYALFHVAIQLLQSAGFSFRVNDSCHNDVSRHLLWCDEPAIQAIGSELGDFRGARNKADYRLNVRDLDGDSTASHWVDAAERYIGELEQAFSGPNRDKIVASIRENRRRAIG